MVEARLQNLFYNQNSLERKEAKFLENDVRQPHAGSKSDFAILFETSNLKSKDLLYNYILTTLLGQVEVN